MTRIRVWRRPPLRRPSESVHQPVATGPIDWPVHTLEGIAAVFGKHAGDKARTAPPPSAARAAA